MKTYDLKLIQVLWVEDDQDAVERGQMDAYSFGLQLEAFPCWDDAKIALEEEFDRWSAIILDAKCKHHADSEDNAVRFLGEALKDISTICKDKRIIPWYVFTGGDEGEVSNSINDDRMKWDSDWTESKKKKYYSKNTDDEELYRRIRYHAQKSHRLQIYEKYQDAINVLNTLNQDASDNILDIFEAMHYPADHSEFKPILYYNPLRQILEYNFRVAYNAGIIPIECFDKNGHPNLSQCCHYLSGNNAKIAGVRYGEYRGENDYDRVTPLHIELMMRMMLDVGNTNSHSTKLNDAELQELEQYFNKNVFNSRYLIFSMAFNACEITLWMKDYINSHQNIDENRKMCRAISDNQPTSKGLDETDVKEEELVGVVLCDNGIYHIGKRFFITKNNVDRFGLHNKKVRIVEHDINTNSSAKDIYPYFACKVKLVKE